MARDIKRKYRRCLITRPVEDVDKTSAALIEMGFDVLSEPLLEIIPTIGSKPLIVSALSQSPQAVIITSANGIRIFSEYTANRDIKIIAVGDSSAEVAKQKGFTDVHSASGDVEDLGKYIVNNLKPEDGLLVHIAGNVIAGDLQGFLSSEGFEVERICAYEAKAAEDLSSNLKMALANCEVDFVVFYSARTARIFEDLLKKNRLDYLAANMIVFSISKSISQELSWRNIFISEQSNEKSLLELIDRETSDTL